MKKQFNGIAGSGKRMLCGISFLLTVISGMVGTTITSEAVIVPASYIIYKNGTTYYAQNGQTGVNDCSGTDASTVIQCAINALGTTRGRIFFKNGSYIINTTISVTTGHLFSGEDWRETALRAGVSNMSIFEIGNCADGILPDFRDLTLDGQSNFGTRAIRIIQSAWGIQLRLSRVEIRSFTHDWGAITDHDASQPVAEATFNNVHFISNNVPLYVRGECYVFNKCKFTGSNIGYMIKPGCFALFSNCDFLNNVIDLGFASSGVDYGQLIDCLKFDTCWFEGSDNSIINATGLAQAPLFKSLTFESCSLHTDNTTYLLNLGNIRGYVYCYRGAVWSAVNSVNIGTGINKFKSIDVYNGVKTENSGTATISAGTTSVNVSHNLVNTPTRVYLTPTTDTGGRRYWVSAKGTSTFTITISSTYTQPITFDWKVEM